MISQPKVEQYLAKAVGDTDSSVDLPRPTTPIDRYLYRLCISLTPEQLQQAIEDYLSAHPESYAPTDGSITMSHLSDDVVEQMDNSNIEVLSNSEISELLKDIF